MSFGISQKGPSLRYISTFRKRSRPVKTKTDLSFTGSSLTQQGHICSESNGDDFVDMDL